MHIFKKINVCFERKITTIKTTMSHIKGRTIQINKNVKQKFFFFVAKNVKQTNSKTSIEYKLCTKIKIYTNLEWCPASLIFECNFGGIFEDFQF